MENKSQKDQMSSNSVGGNLTGHKRGWFGIWGLLAVLNVILAGTCVYWIITIGIWKALESDEFAYLAIATMLLLVCISARLTKRMFSEGFVIDRRNYIDMSRAQWLKRRGSSGTDDADR